MKILVTGAAGFIGFHLTQRLVGMGHEVIGLDNLNTYYDVNLKYARLRELGFTQSEFNYGEIVVKDKNLGFIKCNLEDYEVLSAFFKKNKFDVIMHLAAQAGVRYSIESPFSYVQSNLVGFSNILELCRHHGVGHLIFASSSSVYGDNLDVPFKEDQKTDQQVSLYAATKKSNEVMAHAYSHLYGFQTTGLRFFTVYGPWGRPDMAPMLFAEAISKGNPIKVFNNGEMQRDFTYIDDIIEGLVKMLNHKRGEDLKHEVFNIGNASPIQLMDFITTMENELGEKALLQMMPMQPGDVKITYADTGKLEKAVAYRPTTSLQEGLCAFVKWYKDYHNFEQKE